MSRFTTRVELHKANSDNYDTLHEKMENEGFTRTIKGDSDKEYHLPEAEYNYDGSITLDAVMTKAKAAANATGKDYSILITESTGRKWYNLDEV